MITDAFDNEILPGKRVIYNLSGELALGEVISAEITKREKTTYPPYERLTYLIKIRVIKSTYRYKIGKVSNVRNPNSIVVIEGIPS